MEPIKASLIRVPDQGGVGGRARTGGRGVIIDSRNPKSADNSPLENPRTRALRSRGLSELRLRETGPAGAKSIPGIERDGC